VQQEGQRSGWRGGGGLEAEGFESRSSCEVRWPDSSLSVRRVLFPAKVSAVAFSEAGRWFLTREREVKGICVKRTRTGSPVSDRESQDTYKEGEGGKDV